MAFTWDGPIYIVYLRRKKAYKWVIASSEYDQRDVKT